MADRPIGERVAAVEVSLRDHIRSCERLQERSFKLLLAIIGGLATVCAKLFGLV